jgi:serine phosphatase RsbU (regulator of sigma subunit)
LPEVEEGILHIDHDTKLVMFTDGLAELDYKNQNNPEGGLLALELCLSNNEPLGQNIDKLIEELNIEKSNPALFDDITILGIDFF